MILNKNYLENLNRMEDSTKLNNANFIAIDFETATKKRSACQIGIVVVKEGKIVKRINELIQPPRNIYNSECIKIHGITPDKTVNAPTFDVIWEDIKKYFIGNFIVAHNASFDLDVLRRELNRYHKEPPRIMGWDCTYKITGMKLDLACQTYNVPLCDHHDGLCDAEACARLFLKYLNGEIESKHGYDNEIDPFAHKESHPKYHEAINGDLLVQDLTSANPNNPFYDKKVVITGVFEIERMELAQRIKNMGAKISNSISSKTDIVIIGNEPGPSKLRTLEQLLEEGAQIMKVNEIMLKEILDNE